jgi:Tfp pilus assembly protein PilO
MNPRLLDKKIGGLILVGVAALGLLYFLVIKPQQRELRRIKVEVKEKEALYAKLGVLSRLIDELREEKAVISQTMDRFLKAREIGEMGLVVPDSLMKIFRESKVKVNSISPVPERTEGDLLISSWNVSISTSYNELGHFISRLERSADFNRVDTLSISPGGTSSEYQVQLVVSRISLLKREQEEK